MQGAKAPYWWQRLITFGSSMVGVKKEIPPYLESWMFLLSKYTYFIKLRTVSSNMYSNNVYGYHVLDDDVIAYAEDDKSV